MNNNIFLLFFLLGSVLLSSCRSEVVQPTSYQNTNEAPRLYPDYRNITIPPNIAPLNTQVRNHCEASLLLLGGTNGQLLTEAHDGIVQMDSLAWRQLLMDHRGKTLKATLYTQREGKWYAHPSYQIHVAAEEIDPYLSYRLIEPSYELYRQVGIYQRNLSNFTETPIYENNAEFDEQANHCVNCHNYQNYNTDRMLFHIRANHGGTIFVQGDKAQRVDMRNDSILAGCVYPTWHPTQAWVVFSTNKTGQAFHMHHNQKVEVVDYASDLVFYDVDRHRLHNILKTPDIMETFPTWTPDGKQLFFCAAPLPLYAEMPDSLRNNIDHHSNVVMTHHQKVRYNLMSMTFDPTTRTFSAPQLEMDCAAQGKSCSVPRVSPDGRHVLFTLGDFGQFHIWHKSSDLYVKDLHTGKIRPLKRANSPHVDSYHTWSSNGRWIVFSSRRDDGSYTRPYIAYFDAQGRDHKAFLLPQENPLHNFNRMKSYNVPELTRTPVRISAETFRNTIYDDSKTQKVSYGK